MRVHYGCLKEPSNLIVSSRLEPWYSDASTAEECLKLAEVSAAGAVPFGTLHNGMPLSLQLIRGAAVAGTACSGACPAYSEAQRVELRAALSAALCVLQSGYGAIPDSRTGGDMLLWMVRGARFADGAMDLSGMYTAVLFVGSTIAGAACLRLLGRGTAELPVLTVRPEVRGAGLGTAMISRIESILLEAGVKVLLTPALTMWRGPYMPSVLLHGQPLPPPGQQAWGYCLATKAQMRSVLALRPITMPGVLLATKNLSQATILKPRVAHPTLGLDSIAAVSHRQLMQGNFIRAEAVAAAPGAPAYGGGAPTGIAGPSNGGIFGGIAVKAEEANGVGALQHQAQGMNGMIEAAPFMPADGFNTAAQGATVGNGSLTDRLMASLTADEAMN